MKTQKHDTSGISWNVAISEMEWAPLPGDTWALALVVDTALAWEESPLGLAAERNAYCTSDGCGSSWLQLSVPMFSFFLINLF